MDILELIARLQNGESIKVKVRPEYNHLTRRTFHRKLRIQKTQYSASGFDLFVQTPVFRRYTLKESEIVEIL